MFIFERKTETERELGTGRERGRHRRRSRLQALGWQHRAWRGARTHKPWDHDLSQSWTPNRLSHPGAPKFFFNVVLFLRERETDRVWAGVGQRERETESEAGSRLWVVSIEPNVGLEPVIHEIMTWAKVRHLTNCSTQVPWERIFRWPHVPFLDKYY